ncbi:MAG: 2-amino-4-hydroxy-6-hydroxymethyldihydropteridine diphosphokinase [Pseudomonadota bacterium]
MVKVFVSVGSNIDKEANIRSALLSLRDKFGELLISTVYENPAVGFKGDNFHNLVIGFDTDRTPEDVAEVLRRIELRQGRKRGEARFAPRTLDLDLLLYGDLVIDHQDLQFPRDEISRYDFVLGPLAELAGDMKHPTLGISLKDLWDQMDSKGLRPVEFEI